MMSRPANLLLLILLAPLLTVGAAQSQTWEYATLEIDENLGYSWAAPAFQASFRDTLADLIESVEAEYGSLPPCPQRLGGPCIQRHPMAHFLNLVGQDGWRLTTTGPYEHSGLGFEYVFMRPASSEGRSD